MPNEKPAQNQVRLIYSLQDAQKNQKQVFSVREEAIIEGIQRCGKENLFRGKNWQ